MIKLTKILKESDKKLHKVTTMKDEPPFMTEEQFNEKWSKEKKVNERIDWDTVTLGVLSAKLVYRIISGYLSVNPSKKAALMRFIGMGAPKNKIPKN